MDYLACDLGAESGRIIAGRIRNGVLELEELHRFANVPIRNAGSIHWNFSNLILEIKEGLRKAAKSGCNFRSISTDSWGVDYVLFDQQGEVLPPVFHYRDPRTAIGMKRVMARFSSEAIYEATGIQQMPINTLFQLAAEDPKRLENADQLLGVADAVHYFLSGEARQEVSMASTFQLYDPRKRVWADDLIEGMAIPKRLFPKLARSGEALGRMRAELAAELGFQTADGMNVVATCSHDTGAAVAGVPSAGEEWAYLSSGTWSLMGVELDEPVIHATARECNFTNEIGYGHSIRFLKNLSGLWILQELKRKWAANGQAWTYQELTNLAEAAPSFKSFINPADERFLAPHDMEQAISGYCKETSQPCPESTGEFIRCALESLALLYKKTLAQIERVTGKRIERMHIVGGGSNNHLLNQFTANALRIEAFAGPAEATSAGNILIQAITSGELASLAEARQVSARSFPVKRFYPKDAELWERAFARFEALP